MDLTGVTNPPDHGHVNDVQLVSDLHLKVRLLEFFNLWNHVTLCVIAGSPAAQCNRLQFATVSAPSGALRRAGART